MAVVSRNQLKAWFKTFAKPLESQFHDWIDSYRHKDDKVAAVDLDPSLLQIINNLPNGNAIQQIIQELQTKATIEQLQVLQQEVSQLGSMVQPVSLTLDSDDTYMIPAGRLVHKFVAIGGDNDTQFSIGYTNLTDELVEVTTIPAGTAVIFAVDHYKLNDYTLFFNGITSQVNIRIYLL